MSLNLGSPRLSMILVPLPCLAASNTISSIKLFGARLNLSAVLATTAASTLAAVAAVELTAWLALFATATPTAAVAIFPAANASPRPGSDDAKLNPAPTKSPRPAEIPAFTKSATAPTPGAKPNAVNPPCMASSTRDAPYPVGSAKLIGFPPAYAYQFRPIERSDVKFVVAECPTHCDSAARGADLRAWGAGRRKKIPDAVFSRTHTFAWVRGRAPKAAGGRTVTAARFTTQRMMPQQAAKGKRRLRGRFCRLGVLRRGGSVHARREAG